MLTYLPILINLHVIFQHISAALYRISSQASTVRTLSYHLVDKLDCGLCEMGWTCNNWGKLFFSPFRETKELERWRLALLSAGYMRSVWLKTERVCMFGSVSETTAQPMCWWCSVFCLSVFTAHISPVHIYLRALTFLGYVCDQKSAVYSLKCGRFSVACDLFIFTFDNKATMTAREKH